jgi:hypothetical protein
MQKLTQADIDVIEDHLDVSLPDLYQKLLLEVGYGKYGQKAESTFNTIKEIYHPELISTLYDGFFDDPSELFDRYVLFGYDLHKQELWVIDALSKKVANIGMKPFLMTGMRKSG